ncbi:MAG: endonuclease Q family protein [bacterium]|nr:endonuclease Q family protein [bacterium]
MRVIADFHIHSKYSRATSKEMDLPELSKWVKWKGIDLLGTSDFTHPVWLSSLKMKLKPRGDGLFEYNQTVFILTVEVSNLWNWKGAGKRVHNLIFAPSFEVVDKINKKLSSYGSLTSDGRPMLSLPGPDLVKIVLDVSSECMVIPAHAWTPWYSVFGSMSGFDGIQDCFGDQAKYIYAIETGLSSDPAMNWRLSALDKITLISNSDAHSPSRLGREANVFELPELSYKSITDAIKKKDKNIFQYTVEFYPEEGKYHYDGHRACQQRLAPQETKKLNGICPVCKKPVTVGVMYRVDQLADRDEGFTPNNAIPYKNLVPLEEIIAAAIDKAPGTVAVQNQYQQLISTFQNEFHILLDLTEEELKRGGMPSRIIDGIMKVRKGELTILPGYDGEYGIISIFPKDTEKQPDQLSLF